MPGRLSRNPGVEARSAALGQDLVRRAAAMAPTLREREAETRRTGQVSDETIAEFVGAGFYKVLQPKAYGATSYPRRLMAITPANWLQAAWPARGSMAWLRCTTGRWACSTIAPRRTCGGVLRGGPIFFAAAVSIGLGQGDAATNAGGRAFAHLGRHEIHKRPHFREHVAALGEQEV